VINALNDPMAMTFNLSTQNHTISGVSQGIPIPSLDTLGSFVFELCSRLINRHADKQTNSNILPTPTDSDDVGRIDLMKLSAVRNFGLRKNNF